MAVGGLSFMGCGLWRWVNRLVVGKSVVGYGGGRIVGDVDCRSKNELVETVSLLTNIAYVALGLGAATTALSSSLYTVDGGQRTVIFDRVRGILNETVNEGTHFLVPWLQKPFIFDICTKPYTFSSVSGTKDLQMVNLTLRVLSRPEVKTLGLEYDEKVLPSIRNEVLKPVVAQFNIGL
nr:prohibitin-3, mitochondrial-like [Quercus suber]